MLYNGGSMGDIELGDIIKSSLLDIARELKRANALKEQELILLQKMQEEKEGQASENNKK